jgi:hypothetical protein
MKTKLVSSKSVTSTVFYGTLNFKKKKIVRTSVPMASNYFSFVPFLNIKGRYLGPKCPEVIAPDLVSKIVQGLFLNCPDPSLESMGVSCFSRVELKLIY